MITLNIKPIVLNARDKRYLEQIKNRDYNNCATLEEATRMLVIDLLRQKCDDQFALNVINRARQINESLDIEAMYSELKDRKLLSAFIKGFLSEIDKQQKSKNIDSEESNSGATE